MRSPSPNGLSVRARTTIAATVGVAIALTVASLALLVLMRGSLADRVESSAENRAEALADQIEAGGLPAAPDRDDDDDDVEDGAEQVVAGGDVVWSTSSVRLPTEEAGDARLGDEETGFVVAVEDVEHDGVEYLVSVAASREDVDESTDTLLPLLVAGVPLLTLVVAGATWILTGRALRPVAAIRREVEAISATDLSRRVPVPAARDEIGSLATTMNAMLARLERSADQQRRFVSDASHELRSPVASLRQAGEVAAAHPEVMPVDALAETVVAESVRMQRLVEQLLSLTRADEGEALAAVDVDLDDLALAEAQRVRAAGLATDTAGIAPARVSGDSGALSQVMRNLVDNAVRHAASRVDLTVAERDGGVRVTVEDDGRGVPAEEASRIFDRFVRLDEARARDDGGSGLGLAIVRETLGRHGGTVSVETSPLGGARFVVRLPVARS